MTTDSDSECSYVANLADFNVIRVIIINIIVKKIVYNSKKSNSYSNNGNKIVIIVYNSKTSNNYSNNSKKSNNSNEILQNQIWKI